jgi:hypothetical protein
MSSSWHCELFSESGNGYEGKHIPAKYARRCAETLEKTTLGSNPTLSDTKLLLAALQDTDPDFVLPDVLDRFTRRRHSDNDVCATPRSLLAEVEFGQSLGLANEEAFY